MHVDKPSFKSKNKQLLKPSLSRYQIRLYIYLWNIVCIYIYTCVCDISEKQSAEMPTSWLAKPYTLNLTPGSKSKRCHSLATAAGPIIPFTPLYYKLKREAMDTQQQCIYTFTTYPSSRRNPTINSKSCFGPYTVLECLAENVRPLCERCFVIL